MMRLPRPRWLTRLTRLLREAWHKWRMERQAERALFKGARGYVAREIVETFDGKGRRTSREVIKRRIPPNARMARFISDNKKLPK